MQNPEKKYHNGEEVSSQAVFNSDLHMFLRPHWNIFLQETLIREVCQVHPSGRSQIPQKCKICHRLLCNQWSWGRIACFTFRLDGFDHAHSVMLLQIFFCSRLMWSFTVIKMFLSEWQVFEESLKSFRGLFVLWWDICVQNYTFTLLDKHLWALTAHFPPPPPPNKN